MPEKELAKCNKTILIDEPTELNSILFRAFRSGNTKLYLGEDALITIPRFLRIRYINWDKQGLINKNVQRMMHSGIFKYRTHNSELEVLA
jgi:hypothetical protein